MRRHLEARDANTSDRLEAYVARTENPLNLIALLTLWVVVVPVGNLGAGDDVVAGLVLRLSVSLVFGLDLVIRAVLAPRPVHYVVSHPIRLLAVVLPPVRVVFSFRLVSSLFVRGNLVRFLTAALMLMVNGALIVYFFERDVPGATITTAGGAIWWGVVTVATVGYGDMYPITPTGRVVASLMMAIGITTIAVVTAQVSSSFVSQPRAPGRGALHRLFGHRTRDGSQRDGPGDDRGPVPASDDGQPASSGSADTGREDGDVVQELLDRLDRIERQLNEIGGPPST